MKKALTLAAMATFLPSTIASHADAGNPPRSRPDLSQFMLTQVAGTFTVPAPPTGELTGFACSNIQITATSKDSNPPPSPNAFASPKWTRTTTAKGTYASGSCSYSMVVPAGSAFYLSASGVGQYACHYIATWIGPTGTTVGPITVPLATTKTQNFAITKVSCEYIN